MAAKYKLNIDKTSDEVTTRELILERSLELINVMGMVDFRIDTLATSLGLSPGNITYHFSRKEDICVALWEQYLAEYGNVRHSLTTLIDIKQLYLINRINIYLSYKYRGVVMFRSADLGAMERDIERGRINEEEHDSISHRVVQLLDMNGYLEPDVDGTIRGVMDTYHYIMMRWSLNMAFQNYPVAEVESKLDMLALLVMYAMYPIFGPKGRAEFGDVMAKVEAGNLLGVDNSVTTA